MSRKTCIPVLAGVLALAAALAHAAEPTAPSRALQLSPGVKALLTAEMVEIARGVQGMTLSIASADWASIQSISTRIHASYILERQLTPAQAEELERALPERFKELDAEFHARALRLGAAAAAHDAELVVYQYSRLIESCTACHAAYAAARFPGFAAPTSHAH